jgi:hypothetical protein
MKGISDGDPFVGAKRRSLADPVKLTDGALSVRDTHALSPLTNAEP